MRTGFSLIEKKLLAFNRKYYLSKIIKGFLVSIIVILLLTLFLFIAEYLFYLSPDKKVLGIYSYAFAVLMTLTYFIIFPLFGYFGIRNSLSKTKANKLITNHFPEIQDKLLNIFELNNNTKESYYSEELIVASINQKIDQIKPFHFNDAIQLKENLRFFYLLIVFVFINILIFTISPSGVKETATRLIEFNSEFTKPSPYQFKLINEVLKTGKGDDFKLKVEVETKRDLNNLYLNFGGNTYLMKRDSSNVFTYSFNAINNTIDFYFSVDNFTSRSYRLDVLNKPFIASFTIELNKPDYTRQKTETFSNITTLVVPEGSKSIFTFNVADTDSIIIKHNGKRNAYSENIIVFDHNENSNLLLSLKNENFTMNDILSINIETISDEFPLIDIQQLRDSIDYTRVYFRGYIEDDYGFSKLKFITQIKDEIDSVYKIDILKNLLEQDFFYAFDFSPFKGKHKKISYYFEIDDNDVLNNYKTSVSEVFTFEFPDEKDILDFQNEEYDNIEEIIAESMNMTNAIQENIDDLQERLINENLTDFEKKEIVKNIFSQKQNLEKAIKEIQRRNNELKNYMESFTEQNEEIMHKQEEMQAILDEVMSDELKELMDKLNEMMEKFDENNLNEIAEKLDISLDDLSAQLDKNIELLKQMKMEQQLDMMLNNLEKHIEKQEELANMIDEGTKPEELLNEQKIEKDALKEMADQYNEIQKTNEELSQPLDFYDFDKEFGDIDKEFDNSLENQQKNNRSKTKKSMDQNKSNMQNLAFMLQQMKDGAFMEQTMQNLADLIQILDNTIIFSFSQEELLNFSNNNDFAGDILTGQKKLFGDFKVIKDSLYALAKREPSLNMIVNKEIVTIEKNFVDINNKLQESLISQAKINQQLVLTSTNNLSLFLSEVISNLQQQMANSMPGDQNCDKPGNNPNPNGMGNSLKNMQKGLQQQLEKMMQMMQEGGQTGNMPGEMGRALAQQEKMQSMIQKLMNNGNVGSDAHETLKQAEELLNKVREDLLRNNISEQTINRQKEIMTRLLEADNAQMERDIDEKRKSKTANNERVSESVKYFDNNNSINKFEERLIRDKLILNRYYQRKYQNYVNQLEELNEQMP